MYGYYGHSNVGDEAFKCVFNQFLSEAFEVEYKSPSNIQEFSLDYHALIIGGGNLLGGYFLGRLVEMGWTKHPNIYIVGCGLADELGLILLTQFSVKYISIRNSSEINKLKPLFPDVVLTPDIVFSLHPPEKNYDHPDIVANVNKNVGFILSLEYFPNIGESINFEDYSKFNSVQNNLTKIIKRVYSDWNVYLISISNDISHYDEAVSRLLYRSIENGYKNVKVINKGNSPLEAMTFIAQLDHLYSMKFHGLVFGLNSCIKTINISENIKNYDLFSDFSLLNYNINIEQPNNEYGLPRLLEKDYPHTANLLDIYKLTINQEFAKLIELIKIAN